MATKLSLKALNSLPEKISVPAYDRAALSAGIVHIGVGNFHRAHQAVYLHRLFDRGLDLDWAIVGAGVKPYDAAMRDRLLSQDWLSTVVELDPKGYSATVTGAMIDFAAIDPAALVALLAKPQIRIVSLTITEGGYYVDTRSGGFDASHPEIARDAKHPRSPQTVFGILISALARRRAQSIAPFTLMSCDNLPENGRMTRQSVLGLADLLPGGMGDWIGKNVAFPNSMVDCITPATGDRERALVTGEFGIEDLAPVVCEPFRQWVLEDHFPSGRPALEKVGVEFVADVAPYELMKLRILNGGHAAIGYPAALMGIKYVHEAMANPLVSGFLGKLERDELMPTVPPIGGVDFKAYFRKVAERFSNAAIGDTIARLCLDGSNRQPKFILPALRERLKGGLPVDGLALEVALWCRYCAGADDAGREIAVADENGAMLKELALKAKQAPSAFLDQPRIFGDLSSSRLFREKFSSALSGLWRHGAAKLLGDYLDSRAV